MISPSAEQTRERAEKLRDWLLNRESDSFENHTGRLLRSLLDLLASQDRALGEAQREIGRLSGEAIKQRIRVGSLEDDAAPGGRP